jgi:hypothetical protein
MTPRFAVPRMPNPPKLDGRIDADEWRSALAVSGVGGCTDSVLVARPTTYFLAWDEQNLYMAIRVWVKPGYKPRGGGRQNGAAGVFDDSGEFDFAARSVTLRKLLPRTGRVIGIRLY